MFLLLYWISRGERTSGWLSLWFCVASLLLWFCVPLRFLWEKRWLWVYMESPCFLCMVKCLWVWLPFTHYREPFKKHCRLWEKFFSLLFLSLSYLLSCDRCVNRTMYYYAIFLFSFLNRTMHDVICMMQYFLIIIIIIFFLSFLIVLNSIFVNSISLLLMYGFPPDKRYYKAKYLYYIIRLQSNA